MLAESGLLQDLEHYYYYYFFFLNLQSHYNNDNYNNKIQKEEKKESKQEKKPTCKIYTTKLIIQLTIQRRMTYLHEHYVPWFSYHNIAYKSYIAVC